MNHSEFTGTAAVLSQRDRQSIASLLMDIVHNQGVERRVEPRHPFVQSVSLTVDGMSNDSLVVFTREISASGIGLLHNAKLDTGTIELTFDSPTGNTCRIATEIIWCRALTEGWYISGGRFVVDDEVVA